MQINKIGRYTIMTEPNKWKQIYSPNNRMLQITNSKVFYIDTHLMKTIKEFKKILSLVKPKGKICQKF